MSFLRKLAGPPKDKPSRFLEVAADAEIGSPPPAPLAGAGIPAPIASPSRDFIPGFQGLGGEGNVSFADVVRAQELSDVTGRYTHHDAQATRTARPPRFKRLG